MVTSYGNMGTSLLTLGRDKRGPFQAPAVDSAKDVVAHCRYTLNKLNTVFDKFALTYANFVRVKIELDFF